MVQILFIFRVRILMASAQSNALDALFQAMEYTHSQGLLFGVGAHSLETIMRSIELGVKPDFYYKTFHHDNYWSATPKDRREEYPTTFWCKRQELLHQPEQQQQGQHQAGAPAAAAAPAARPPQVLAGSPGAPRGRP